ncbi:MAG: cold shock domain-containing protein [Planctomycetaceae bacterium]|nr:cold shock domain-containing protein [Planctomycetaceae bacterium]
MATGKVKWFDPKKGYGFIVGDNDQDVFVHYSSISGEGFRALKDGEVVQYDLVKSDKGLQAHNVSRVVVQQPTEASGQSVQA